MKKLLISGLLLAASAAPAAAAPATIALAAGGTGGHLFPAVAPARALVARGHEVVFHTGGRGAQ